VSIDTFRFGTKRVSVHGGNFWGVLGGLVLDGEGGHD